MFAIVQSGGKHYRVKPGQFIRVDLLDLEVGKKWQSQVLALQDSETLFQVGKPFIEKSLVKGLVVRHGKNKKVVIFKKNRRKGYRKTKGHRHSFTELFIELIATPTGKIERAKKIKKAKTILSAEKDIAKKDPIKKNLIKKNLNPLKEGTKKDLKKAQ